LNRDHASVFSHVKKRPGGGHSEDVLEVKARPRRTTTGEASPRGSLFGTVVGQLCLTNQVPEPQMGIAAARWCSLSNMEACDVRGLIVSLLFGVIIGTAAWFAVSLFAGPLMHTWLGR